MRKIDERTNTRTQEDVNITTLLKLAFERIKATPQDTSKYIDLASSGLDINSKNGSIDEQIKIIKSML
jgi:hypothetical protein